jgi:hypothetical protein
MRSPVPSRGHHREILLNAKPQSKRIFFPSVFNSSIEMVASSIAPVRGSSPRLPAEDLVDRRQREVASHGTKNRDREVRWIARGSISDLGSLRSAGA